MAVSKLIMIIMAVFFVLGALDRFFGGKLGMGAEFERAFGLMGPTALSALGILAFAPVIAAALKRPVSAVFSLIGADPAMFPAMLMSCEVSYPLSAELAADSDIALFGGLIVGSVMGFVISFTIPVACGLIRKKDCRPFAAGILAAYCVDPIACFVGGIAMGLEPLTVLINLIPVIILALIIIFCLLFIPETIIRVFRAFAKLLLGVITLGLCAAAVEAMTGIVLIPGMNPIRDGFVTVGTIVLSLGGSLPLLYVLRKLLSRPLAALGRLLGINDVSMLSIVIALTSLVPGYSQYSLMNNRGRVIYSAISASIGCVLGCHLGFTSGVDRSVVAPMLTAKFLAGLLALAAGAFFSRRLFSREELEAVD